MAGSREAWVKGHPTAPGIYRVRGWHVGAPDDFAVVEVVSSGVDLICNLHCKNSNRDFEDWIYLQDCNADFEWQRVGGHR